MPSSPYCRIARGGQHGKYWSPEPFWAHPWQYTLLSQLGMVLMASGRSHFHDVSRCLQDLMCRHLLSCATASLPDGSASYSPVTELSILLHISSPFLFPSVLSSPRSGSIGAKNKAVFYLLIQLKVLLCNLL